MSYSTIVFHKLTLFISFGLFFSNTLFGLTHQDKASLEFFSKLSEEEQAQHLNDFAKIISLMQSDPQFLSKEELEETQSICEESLAIKPTDLMIKQNIILMSGLNSFEKFDPDNKIVKQLKKINKNNISLYLGSKSILQNTLATKKRVLLEHLSLVSEGLIETRGLADNFKKPEEVGLVNNSWLNLFKSIPIETIKKVGSISLNLGIPFVMLFSKFLTWQSVFQQNSANFSDIFKNDDLHNFMKGYLNSQEALSYLSDENRKKMVEDLEEGFWKTNYYPAKISIIDSINLVSALGLMDKVSGGFFLKRCLTGNPYDPAKNYISGKGSDLLNMSFWYDSIIIKRFCSAFIYDSFQHIKNNNELTSTQLAIIGSIDEISKNALVSIHTFIVEKLARASGQSNINIFKNIEAATFGIGSIKSLSKILTALQVYNISIESEFTSNFFGDKSKRNLLIQHSSHQLNNNSTIRKCIFNNCGDLLEPQDAAANLLGQIVIQNICKKGLLFLMNNPSRISLSILDKAFRGTLISLEKIKLIKKNQASYYKFLTKAFAKKLASLISRNQINEAKELVVKAGVPSQIINIMFGADARTFLFSAGDSRLLYQELDRQVPNQIIAEFLSEKMSFAISNLYFFGQKTESNFSFEPKSFLSPLSILRSACGIGFKVAASATILTMYYPYALVLNFLNVAEQIKKLKKHPCAENLELIQKLKKQLHLSKNEALAWKKSSFD